MFYGRGMEIFQSNAFCCYGNVSLWSILARAKWSSYLHIHFVLMKMKPKLPVRYEGKLFILKSKLFLLFHVLKKEFNPDLVCEQSILVLLIAKFHPLQEPIRIFLLHVSWTSLSRHIFFCGKVVSFWSVGQNVLTALEVTL